MSSARADQITPIGEADVESAALLASEPVYDENGVDLSLIRWTLKLTPAERLQSLQGMTELVEAAHG